MFAYGEGQSKKTIAVIVFGVGMAIGAVKLKKWPLSVACSRAISLGNTRHSSIRDCELFREEELDPTRVGEFLLIETDDIRVIL